MRPVADLAPEEIIESLERYRDHGIPTGSFLKAVLENDLSEAVGRADCQNLVSLPHIVAWVCIHIPINKRGSREVSEAWLKYKEEERKKERGGA